MKQKDLKIKQKQSSIKTREGKRNGQNYHASPLKERMKADYIRTKTGKLPEKGTDEAADSAVEQYEEAAVSAGLYGLDAMQKIGWKAKAYADFKYKTEQEAFREHPFAAEPKKNVDFLSGERLEGRFFHTERTAEGKGCGIFYDFGESVQQESFSVPISERKMEKSGRKKAGQRKFIKSITEKRFGRRREKREAANGMTSPEMTKSGRDLHTTEKSAGAQQISYTEGKTAAAQHRFSERTKRSFPLSGNGESYSAAEKKAAGYQKNHQRKAMQSRFLTHTKNPTVNRASAKSISTGERIAQAVQRTAKEFVKGILVALGGLSGLVVIFVIIGAIAALASTAFGIFFSPFDDTAGTKQIAEIVAEGNSDFYARVSRMESDVAHDVVQYHMVPDGGDTLFITNWTEVVAIFAAKLSGDSANALDVITMDGERAVLLKEVFGDMNRLSYETERIGEETILHITLTSKTYREMFDAYDSTPYQREAAEELMKPEYAQMLSELIGTIGISGGSVSLSEEQIREMLENLPEELSAERKAVMQAAYSLVGKVSYFWGGKSEVIGWDSRWGTPKKVTAAGSTTTGSLLPFGLDCSGFVTWVFINATGNTSYANIIGHGAANQYSRCEKISWSEAQAGDLVFYPDLGHVGIIAGRDENGELLVVHCASSQKGVVVTGVRGFIRIGRPVLYAE